MNRTHAHFRTLAVLLLCCARSLALNPALAIGQDAHYAWKNSDGFSKGAIQCIAQTPDGYLWLGTPFGLLRFDGIHAVPWSPPAGQQLPSDDIQGLLVSRDGTLWIATLKGLASWKDGKLTPYAELEGGAAGPLLEDREGTVWSSGRTQPGGNVCAMRPGAVKCYGLDGRFGSGAFALREYRGDLWIGTSTGLWRWNPGSARPFPLPDTVNDLIEGDNGALWIATTGGIRQFVSGTIQGSPLPLGGQYDTYRFRRDREGGLWIATLKRGLFHAHRGRTDQFAAVDGLSSDHVSSLFEDREGNIWAGTNDGLDRFRDFAVSTITTKQGLSAPGVAGILADRDGDLWIAAGEGLNRWNNGQMTVYRSPGYRPPPASSAKPGVREIVDGGLPAGGFQSLFQDHRGRVWVTTLRGVAYVEDGRFVSVLSMPKLIVHSIAEDRTGDLWISDQELGLLNGIASKSIEAIPWTRLGSGDVATTVVADTRRSGLWLGFYRGGVSYFQDGAIRSSYPSAAGLAAGRVFDLRLDGSGSLWVAAEGGLSRIQNGRITTLSRANGLPCDTAQWTVEDNSGALWLDMPCGLVSIPRLELDAWSADPKRAIRVRVFDRSDGVQHYGIGGFAPHVAKLPDGTLWFANPGGVGMIDPRHIPTNTLPPPVSIEQITADGKPYMIAPGSVRLPKLIRDLEIDYTALSFVAPEKNRFRYKLEGHDTEWTDAGTRRQAFYNDLAPKRYRFRAQASDNNGVWNEAGAYADFSVDPAYYQTKWFRAACALVFLALLAGIWLRLLYLTRQFDMRLEERVGERTRIARDLHDTLLQSFQGVLLKFHAVTYMIQDHPEARKMQEAAIEEARRAIAEGRDAVQGLRSSTVITEDIARAITTLGEGLAAGTNGNFGPQFLVHLEGTPRSLPPVVRDEIYRIAAEGLRNAFQHSGARRIEVDIHYDKRRFQLRVRDNGKGIDRHILNAGGLDGHHGLPGMQQRAGLVGGKLAIWSERDSGTEVELNIAAAIAYAKSPAARQTAQGTGSK